MKDIYKEIFHIYGGKCLSHETIHSLVEKFSQGRSKFANDEAEEWEWLRQQSKDFYAVGFNALVKRWDECINVSGGYVDK
jgi:hypothetical protein